MQGRGRFLTVEGGEGTGKSTQARRLAAGLRDRGLTVVETREPGGSEGAERLRSLLVDGPEDQWDPMTEALILAAARRDHLRHTVRPALDRGAWVVCDRFMDSTMAYQGHGHGVPLETLETLYDIAAGAFMPDLTLILDHDPAVGLARARARGPISRYERLDAAFHHRVCLGFLEIAARDPERCVVISAEGDEETVAHRIDAAVQARMDTWRADADVVGPR